MRLAADLVFRWAVESQVKGGWEYEQAAIKSQACLRLWQLAGSSAAFERLLDTIEAQSQDGCETASYQRADHAINASTFEIHGGGGEMLAIHDAAEFARHAAVWSGWSFLELRGPFSNDALLLLLSGAANDGLAAVALSAPTRRVEDLRLGSWVDSANEGAVIVELPGWQCLLQDTPLFGNDLPSLRHLLDLGVSLPANARTLTAPCVQFFLANERAACLQVQARFHEKSQQCGPSSSLIRKLESLSGFVVVVDESLRERMSKVARIRSTFDPFS